MTSYFHVVAPLSVMWPVTEMLLPLCECPFFKRGWGERCNFVSDIFSIMNQNGAERRSDIVN